MRAAFAIVSTALLGCTVTEPPVGTQRAAIVGGAPDPKHTAVLDILVEREQSCSGTLISPHVVLTAAHCIVEDVEDATELEVFTGPDESNLAGGKIHKVVSGPIHPTYGKDPKDEEAGDLAVLILAEPSTITPMQYAREPLSSGLIGAPALMIGYGDTTIKDPTSGGGKRLIATSPLLELDENWLVVGERGTSQCYGDSGGPVVMVIDGVEQVVGVNSWQEGDDCDVANFNTRVDRLSSWIDAQVQAADPGFDPSASAPSAANREAPSSESPSEEPRETRPDIAAGPDGEDGETPRAASGGCGTSGASPHDAFAFLLLLLTISSLRRRASLLP